VSAHTPGPWFISRSCMGVHKYIEARIGGGMIQEVACCGPTETHEQSDANAQLIVASPGLLTALEELERWVVGVAQDYVPNAAFHETGGFAAMEAARAAIAKATTP
jgi:hypothetical protein